MWISEQWHTQITAYITNMYLYYSTPTRTLKSLPSSSFTQLSLCICRPENSAQIGNPLQSSYIVVDVAENNGLCR